MKKIIIFASLLMFVAAAYAQKSGNIVLETPNLERSGSMMKALSDRKSTREYSSAEISMRDLSDLLWAANGYNRVEQRKRTAPSSRDKQDIDVYVFMEKGIYLYDALTHSLILKSAGDHRQVIATEQEYAGTAPISLLIVSELARIGNDHNERVKMSAAMNAGIVSQNVSLFCASAGLGTVPRGMMDSAKIREVLPLTPTQLILLNHPVGYLK